MRELPTIHVLPASLYREIGRVIVVYARLEWLLSQILYASLGVSQKEGRIAVGEPRATDRFERIVEILEVKAIPFKTELDPIRAAIKAGMDQRNQLAHGVWLRAPESGAYILTVTRGSWQPIKGQKGKTSRKIAPEGVEYGVDDCRSLYALIERTIEHLEAWNAELVEHQASRKKCPA
jgi:hypothetical protein